MKEASRPNTNQLLSSW